MNPLEVLLAVLAVLMLAVPFWVLYRPEGGRSPREPEKALERPDRMSASLARALADFDWDAIHREILSRATPFPSRAEAVALAFLLSEYRIVLAAEFRARLSGGIGAPVAEIEPLTAEAAVALVVGLYGFDRAGVAEELGRPVLDPRVEAAVEPLRRAMAQDPWVAALSPWRSPRC